MLYRAMKESANGLPELGASARALGVRRGIDVPAINAQDLIHPGQGGLSVSPDDPLNLPYFRRPPQFQGTGRDPIWSIKETELGTELVYGIDPNNAKHGFIEPMHVMTLADFQDAVFRLQSLWSKVTC